MEYREEIIPQYTSSADVRVASLHKILEYRSNFSGKSTAIYRLLSDILPSIITCCGRACELQGI